MQTTIVTFAGVPRRSIFRVREGYGSNGVVFVEGAGGRGGVCFYFKGINHTLYTIESIFESRQPSSLECLFSYFPAFFFSPFHHQPPSTRGAQSIPGGEVVCVNSFHLSFRRSWRPMFTTAPRKERTTIYFCATHRADETREVFARRTSYGNYCFVWPEISYLLQPVCCGGRVSCAVP